MPQMTLSALTEKMRGITVAMLATRADGGEIAIRPMSHNGEVDFDGVSYYFTTEDSTTVAHILHNPKVALSFQGSTGLVDQRPFLMAVEGVAKLIHDRAAFEAHWHAGLTTWLTHDLDTPGLVLIKVRATRIHYWDGDDSEGEMELL